MKSESYWLGHNIKMMGGVRLDKETAKRWYFIVTSDTGKEVFVSIERDISEDNCCCEFGSQWRFSSGQGTPRTCKHIYACRIWLRDNHGIDNAMQGTY